MTEKLVSVIMSVYNEEKSWVIKSIESILNQTYENIEFIIVMDNPENVELLNIVDEFSKRDSRIRVIKNEFNKGLVYSLNKALNNSKGSFIARMDADDIATKERLELQLKYMQKHEIDLLTSRAYFINENDELIGESVNFKNSIQINNSLKYKNRLIHPTWMIKRSVIFDSKINLYNNIPYAEDYDLAYRLIINGFKIEQMSEYCLYYRVRDNGISKANYYNGLKSAEFISKNLKKYIKNEVHNYCEILIKLQNNTSENKLFNFINSKVSNNKIKSIALMTCKYYRRNIIRSFLCRIKYGI